jgi:hypothetical protein
MGILYKAAGFVTSGEKNNFRVNQTSGGGKFPHRRLG